jgi:hypothetical protein
MTLLKHFDISFLLLNFYCPFLVLSKILIKGKLESVGTVHSYWSPQYLFEKILILICLHILFMSFQYDCPFHVDVRTESQLLAVLHPVHLLEKAHFFLHFHEGLTILEVSAFLKLTRSPGSFEGR